MAGLNSDAHRDSRYYEHLRLHTRIFQDPPDGLDETWTHGLLFLGPKIGDYLGVARSYKLAVDEMISAALRSNEAHKYDYPILYLCRHTLELYLKMFGYDRRPDDTDDRTHSLAACMREVEKKLGQKIAGIFRSWIEEFHAMDEKGATFRYEDGTDGRGYHVELWVDLHQLQFAMDRLCAAFEQALPRDFFH